MTSAVLPRAVGFSRWLQRRAVSSHPRLPMHSLACVSVKPIVKSAAASSCRLMKRMWPLIFFAAGVAVLIYGIGLIMDARNCASWPSVQGNVISSEAQVVGREKDKRTYAPAVVFTYLVNGTTYQGTRVTLVPRNYGLLSSVQSVLSRYPVGGTTRVFHDPKNPANSVLVNSPVGTEWAYALGSLAFIAVGVWMWFEK